MSDQGRIPAGSRNIHAPWRIEYIRMLGGEDEGCFLCRCRDEVDRDEENLVLWRTSGCLAVLNRFPYTGGHLLIAPLEHVASLECLSRETMAEMMSLASDAVRALARAVRAEGFNVGINIGRCAGAGLPGHVHMHVVPRWGGDTNFMAVLGDVRVIPQALSELRRELLAASGELHLPRGPDAGPDDQ
jgi:ATP adenylyltransferase